jgi:cell division protein FtsQ
MALTGAVLLYAAVRFAIGSAPPSRASIISDAVVPRDLAAFISRHAGEPEALVAAAGAFPSIESASAMNRQDGSILVRLSFKKIIASWTDGKNFYPLSESGPIMMPLPGRPKGLLFAGRVPPDVADVIAAVNSHGELARMTNYVAHNGRRWDIFLSNGASILLPEENIATAIDEIRSLGILNKSFQSLDLRDPKRTLVK